MKKKSFLTAAKTAVLIAVSLLWLFPLAWAVFASVRPGQLVTSFDLSLRFSGGNIRYVFTSFPFFKYMGNSLIFVSGILAAQLFTITLASYAVARMEFIGKKLVMLLIMAHIIIPGEVLLLSNYLTIRDLGLVDRRLGVMIVSFGSAMGILLMRQSYRSLPMALEEAAVLDGCNLFQKLWYIFIPSCKTAYLSFAIISINWHWNAFLWPLIVINSPGKRSLPLGLALLTKSSGDAGPQWAAVATATVMIMLPLLLLFIIFQKQFIKSFLTSGLK